jgi:hypothetical protein
LVPSLFKVIKEFNIPQGLIRENSNVGVGEGNSPRGVIWGVVWGVFPWGVWFSLPKGDLGEFDSFRVSN